MSTPATCEQFRDWAPELALGVLDGAERARALAHVMRCAACRAYLDELAKTADSLLLAGPEAEPPPGFEERTAALLRPSREPHQRWRRFAAVAAAVVALAGVGLAARATAPDKPLREAALVSSDGSRVGRVFLYGDDRGSWCFVSLAAPSAQGEYEVRARLRDGSTVLVQKLYAKDGRGSYGSVMTVQAKDIVEMRVVPVAGSWGYTADLST